MKGEPLAPREIEHQLARRFRELAGFTDEENDSLAALARQSTEEARQMAEAASVALDAQSA